MPRYTIVRLRNLNLYKIENKCSYSYFMLVKYHRRPALYSDFELARFNFVVIWRYKFITQPNIWKLFIFSTIFLEISLIRIVLFFGNSSGFWVVAIVACMTCTKHWTRNTRCRAAASRCATRFWRWAPTFDHLQNIVRNRCYIYREAYWFQFVSLFRVHP